MTFSLEALEKLRREIELDRIRQMQKIEDRRLAKWIPRGRGLICS